MALTFANRLTILRILAVPFFIDTVLYYSPEKDYLRFWAFGIFAMAMITDVIDGYIARSRHEKTTAGAFLDPLADKLLLISAFICLYKIGVFFEAVRFPLWLVIAVISRDVILLLGAMIILSVQGRLDIRPTSWGRAAAFFQVASVTGMFLQWVFSPVLWWITVVFVVISGIDYIRSGVKALNVPSGKNCS